MAFSCQVCLALKYDNWHINLSTRLSFDVFDKLYLLFLHLPQSLFTPNIVKPLKSKPLPIFTSFWGRVDYLGKVRMYLRNYEDRLSLEAYGWAWHYMPNFTYKYLHVVYRRNDLKFLVHNSQTLRTTVERLSPPSRSVHCNIDWVSQKCIHRTSAWSISTWRQNSVKPKRIHSWVPSSCHTMTRNIPRNISWWAHPGSREV